ncbi:MAG: DUF4124 domain-containing protein [Gammaproteobacteria bacterium]
MRTLILVFALLPAFVLAQDAPAPEAPPPAKPKAKDQVYKWVDKDGVVHYSNQPPAEGAKPAKLPPLQTYKGGTNPNLSRFDKPGAKGGAAAGGAVNIEIVTPSNDETFHGGERVVPVAVMVTPQIGAGQKLIYLLDGRPASPPTTDTSFALTGVDRGTHSVSVTLVGEAGDEIAASGSVTFHMRPPTVDQAKPANAPKPGPPPKPKPPKP